MPDFTARITEILRAHQWRKYEDRCRCDDPGTYGEHPDHLAALIAEAAEQHYRPRINTRDELDALSVGSVVKELNRDEHGWTWERWGEGWRTVNSTGPVFLPPRLPAVVLWLRGVSYV